MSSLTSENLAKIEAMLGAPDATDAVLKDFRANFPGVSITRCDPSDVAGEKPYKQFPRFTLYLISAVDHCVTMTLDPGMATGIIVVDQVA